MEPTLTPSDMPTDPSLPLTERDPRSAFHVGAESVFIDQALDKILGLTPRSSNLKPAGSCSSCGGDADVKPNSNLVRNDFDKRDDLIRYAGDHSFDTVLASGEIEYNEAAVARRKCVDELEALRMEYEAAKAKSPQDEETKKRLRRRRMPLGVKLGSVLPLEYLCVALRMQMSGTSSRQ